MQIILFTNLKLIFMKKIYLTMSAALVAASMSAQKAKVVASLGFEDGDAKYTTEYALTPDLGSIHGDWVNVQADDAWDEKVSGDAHSGEYCFQAINIGDADANNWDRGFKIGLDDVKLQTPYRVSFWLKAPSTFTDAEGNEQPTKITSWMSKGMENFDISLMGQDKSEFGLNAVTGITGEWQKFTFVVFTPTRELVKEVVDSRSWVGSTAFPEAFGGGGETYKDHFLGEIPEMYFFIANMKSPVDYLLDDILVEEGVAIKGTSFNTEVIKVDFGYKTNMADLCKYSNGTAIFNTSCASIKVNGEDAEIDYVEGKSDGYLYIFPTEPLNEDDVVEVTFTGDPRLVYTAAVRPTAETGDGVQVIGCEDDIATFDSDIQVEALAWSNPVIESSNPIKGQFGIDSKDLTEITITFTNTVDIKQATAKLIVDNDEDNPISVNMTLSDDKKTITIPVSNLEEGDYNLVIEKLINAIGSVATEPTTLSFSIGEGSGSGEVIEYYALNMEGLGGNMLPLGVTGNGDNSYRIGDGTTSYSGAPRIMGDNSNANQGIYWSQRGGSDPGEVSFGKAWVETQDDQYPAIHLEPGEYVLTYKNAGWDGGTASYNLAVKNSLGEAIYLEEGLKNTENVAQGPDATVAISTTTMDFKVAEEDDYYIEFTTTGGWGGQILTALSLKNKPASEAGYYKEMLANAIADAETILENCDEKYNGETKTNFENTLNKAKTGTYTTPTAIEAIVKELKDATAALNERIASYNDYVKGFEDISTKYENLEGKYKKSDAAREVEKVIAEYGAINPTDLSDAELKDMSSKVKTLSGQVSNIESIVNTLTYQAGLNVTMASLLGNFSEVSEAVDELATDDTELIKKLQKEITRDVYKSIVDGTLFDCLEKVQVWHNSNGASIEEIPVGQEDKYNDAGFPLATEGAEFDAFVRNPHFYTTSRGGNFVNGDSDLPGWTIEQGDAANEEETWMNGTVHFSGDAASDAKPVSDIMINNYGASDYRITQVIDNLPVGVYDVRIDTRTAQGSVVYNAQNEDGIWDKYIFAQVDDQAPVMAPFSVGGYQEVRVCVVNGLEVKEGSKLTIGVVEHYTSGLAEKDGNPLTYWDTNTWVDNAFLYFVAPLEGYDYKAAADKVAQEVETGIATAAVKSNAAGIYNVNGIKVSALQKGINIVVDAEGKATKIVK